MELVILTKEEAEKFAKLTPYEFVHLLFDINDVKEFMENKKEVDDNVLEFVGNPPIGKERPDKP